MVKKMVESQGKRLITETSDDANFKSITYLAASKKDETLYLVYQNSDGEEDCYELATSAEGLTKIRDLLIGVVSKIEENYGLKQSVRILEGE